MQQPGLADSNLRGVNSAEPEARDSLRPTLAALCDGLLGLRALLGRLTAAQYVASALSGQSSGIGGHVRHCLDHVAALLAGLHGGVIDYERRTRGGAVETSAAVAVALLEEQLAALAAGPHRHASEQVEIVLRVHTDGPPMTFRSTLGREAAFVQSHTIHHQALMAALAAAQGVMTPAGFGYAPSTLAHTADAACAR